jgi:hypothetical protein
LPIPGGFESLPQDFQRLDNTTLTTLAKPGRRLVSSSGPVCVIIVVWSIYLSRYRGMFGLVGYSRVRERTQAMASGRLSLTGQ